MKENMSITLINEEENTPRFLELLHMDHTETLSMSRRRPTAKRTRVCMADSDGTTANRDPIGRDYQYNPERKRIRLGLGKVF